MPRRGSREWNRQQNIRRQQEQTIMAQMVEPVIIENAETVIVEATNYDQTPLRQKISELEQQISNKTTQINQLKQNSKENKKLIKKFQTENKKFAEEFTTPYNLTFAGEVVWLEEEEEDMFGLFVLQTTTDDSTDRKVISEYIRKLERIVMCNRQTQNTLVELWKAQQSKEIEKRQENINMVLCKSIIKSHLNDNGILERKKYRSVEMWAKHNSSLFQRVLQEEGIECDIDIYYH